MTEEQLKLLSDIYDLLGTINTKGEDTLKMAECLNALKHLYSQLNNTIETEVE